MAAPLSSPPNPLAQHGSPAHLLPPTFSKLITQWLEEDTPSFDVAGFVVGEEESEARLLGKSEGVLAGVPFFNEVFKQLGCSVEWHLTEGEAFHPIKHCATVRGPARKILLGERVALNTLARCSGIATRSSQILTLLRQAGYPNTVAGTRKTTPGFRLVEKYGMLAGGCDSHRHDLSSMVMLKDNHIWACANRLPAISPTGVPTNNILSAIPSAIAAARATAGFSLKIEVEVGSLDEAHAAFAAGADVVMLDNFAAPEIGPAAKELKDRWGPKALVEVSGGLTEANIGAYACPWVDVISTSAIHQGVKHVDFSLKVVVGKGGGGASA